MLAWKTKSERSAVEERLSSIRPSPTLPGMLKTGWRAETDVRLGPARLEGGNGQAGIVAREFADKEMAGSRPMGSMRAWKAVAGEAARRAAVGRHNPHVPARRSLVAHQAADKSDLLPSGDQRGTAIWRP